MVALFHRPCGAYNLATLGSEQDRYFLTDATASPRYQHDCEKLVQAAEVRQRGVVNQAIELPEGEHEVVPEDLMLVARKLER